MSYTAAALVGVAVVLAVDLAVLRTRMVCRGVFWATYPIMLFFQLLSNGVLAGRSIVRYDPEAIIGLRVAYAPVEDLLFGFALVLLTLSVWVWLGRRGVQRAPEAGERAVNRRGGSPPSPTPPAPRAPRGPARPRPARPRPDR
ncbi:MAG TPA: lycopene cyclase domain-containing protein [Micromonosporaceae bacterium]|nr:lycopene cyclase domain-containing protein [Micromonosporaceae bacterium]